MRTALLTLLFVGGFGTAPAVDQIADSELAEGNKVTVNVKTSTGTKKKTFDFPATISEYRVIPFMPGASVIIAAKPREEGDWFWGIAYLGDGSPEKGTVVKWTKSPPHEAKLLAVEHPEGDSFVVYASSFKRDFPNANAIRSYAYVNHCPAAFGDRDPLGCLYSGEIGGPLNFGQVAEPGTQKPSPVVDESAVDIAKRVISDESSAYAPRPEIPIGLVPKAPIRKSEEVQLANAAENSQAAIRSFMLGDAVPEKIRVAYAITVLAGKRIPEPFGMGVVAGGTVDVSKNDGYLRDGLILSARLAEIEGAEND